MTIYKEFIFESYSFDPESNVVLFEYSFDGQRRFEEKLAVTRNDSYDAKVLDKVLRLAFILAGVSYYKAFPTSKVRVRTHTLTPDEAAFFSTVYSHGLSQYVFENKLDPNSLAKFESGAAEQQPLSYSGTGTLVLQSGGKDSLLLAELLKQKSTEFTPLYLTVSDTHPKLLDSVGTRPLRTLKRMIDSKALQQAATDGGLNGHVPVTFIVQAYALIDAVLHNENTILAAIGREGEEPHAYIGNYAVTHQWSKTWPAEQLFAEYVHQSIAPDLRIGSPLRGYSELRIAELFAEHAWPQYGHSFSSCNVANYKQGANNEQLKWCGECPKCANNFLLLAPFVEPEDLKQTIGGNLFKKPSLEQTFKGLLGVDGVMKPFECVGETTELQLAYHTARERYPAAEYDLPFDVPKSSYDYQYLGPAQPWAEAMLQ